MAVEAPRAGMRITAGFLDSITPRWAAWTPTWTTSTGLATPSFGNATLDCSYAQSGDVVFYRMDISFGSTTNFGGGTTTDNWRFSTPVTAQATALAVGAGEAGDASVAASLGRAAVVVTLSSTTTFSINVVSGRPDAVALTAAGLIDTVSPWTWATSDVIRVSGHYRAA